mgnify:CR=1 FL=1
MNAGEITTFFEHIAYVNDYHTQVQQYLSDKGVHCPGELAGTPTLEFIKWVIDRYSQMADILKNKLEFSGLSIEDLTLIEEIRGLT